MRISILALGALIIAGFSCRGQNNDLVANDGITGALHRASIGRVTFMEKTVPIENYQVSDFLSTVTLKENGDFTIRAFLGNSLTNYLHTLAPTLTAEELNKAGNYRFSFYVDGALIYTENLHPGAGD